MRLGLKRLLFVTKVLGTCTCTWSKNYLMYLMLSKYCDYLSLYLSLQVWKVLVLVSSTSESTLSQPWSIIYRLQYVRITTTGCRLDYELMMKDIPCFPLMGLMHTYDIIEIGMTHDNVITWKLSALLALCEGNPPVISGFPSQRASNIELWFSLWC